MEAIGFGLPLARSPGAGHQAGRRFGHEYRILVGQRKGWVDGLCPFDEERDTFNPLELDERRQRGGIGKFQRRHREVSFGRKSHRDPARDEDLERRAGGDELGNERRRFQEMFDVVQDQQDLTLPQEGLQARRNVVTLAITKA